MRQIVIAIAVLVATMSASAAARSATPERTHFLLLDDRVIESEENAKLTVGEVRKHENNPLFGEDKPWEKRFDNFYGNIIYDEDDKIYKCWYSPFIVDHSAEGMTLEERDNKPYIPPNDRSMGLCYATSKDGIHWKKPELGIIEFEGSTNNNIVYRPAHGTGVFKDLYEKDPARRYKLITRDEEGIELAVAFSPDGIHWSEMIVCPEIHPEPVDGTHYNALWVPELDEYVAFTRLRGVGTEVEVVEPTGSRNAIRQVGRTTSKDFLDWSEHKLLMQGQEAHLQIYSMPVFRYGNLYLGLPVIYNTNTDRAHTELAWSTDTTEWHRIDPGNPLIDCSDEKLNYDYGCVYACAYPVVLPDEVRLFYGGSDYLHFGWRTGCLCLATLRPDGFAGYEPVDRKRPAIVTTREIPYDGSPIRITADVENGGSIRVSVINQAGERLISAKPIIETMTDGLLQWNERPRAGRIRLRFEANNAKLFSFTFGSNRADSR